MSSSPTDPTSRLFWLFSAGLALVLLSLWIPYIPAWPTFIHIWRVELFASVFLAVSLGVVFFRSRSRDFLAVISKEERLFVIGPIVAFILCSGLSAFWADSWRSAFHHSLVWSEYLIFYLLIRNLLDSEESRDRILFVLAGVLALYALPAVSGYLSIQIFEGSNTLGVRFSRFGEQAIVVLPILIAVTISQWNKLRSIGIASIASAWLLVLCSMSRTTMFLAILVTIAVLAGIALSGRSKQAKTAIAATLAVFIAAPIFIHLPAFFSQGDTAPVAQRFSDSAGLADSNGFRKLMIALSLEMMADKPLIGIGADNFGSEVHKYRETFASKNPDSPLLAYAENELPERAHNEYLQIAAELGLIGIAIFAWLLVGISVMAWRSVARIREAPIVAFAAIIGIFGFLAAALVTSYSFRFIQNGFFFFFALSIAAEHLLPGKETEEVSVAGQMLSTKWAMALGIATSLMLTVYCVTRVGSVIYQERASGTESRDEADRLYETSSWLDHENPIAFKSNGMRAFRDREFERAVPLLQRSIEMGEKTSTSYSYLASAQVLSGDSAGAENTLREAAEAYPRSVFVQARYSAILGDNGKKEQAAQVFEKARSLDLRAATTWLTLLTKGAVEVSSKAIDPNSEVVNVMDLAPESAIYAVMSERLVKHPEEQKFSMFRPTN
ncbi:MAG: O-antigen ligase family protein [bacterium]|nr:O-antigen ligase family protein [bacterium]